MSLIKALPLRYRLPLIHGTLGLIGKWRARHWTKATSAQAKTGPFIVSGFFNESIGVGRAGQLTAQALEAAGYRVHRHDIRPCFGHIRDQKAQLPGKNGGVWLIHANAPEALVALLSHTPDQWSDRYRIGFWAWETPKAPEYWVWLAAYFHEIWVPSRFVRDALAAAFKAHGADQCVKRLRVMPHPAPEPPVKADRTAFGLSPETCEVLSLFDAKSSAARKNPWAVIAAWTKAFPVPDTQRRLTLKVQDLSDDITARTRLEALTSQRPDIRLFTKRLSDADMGRFAASFDVVVSLHRSEGFGLSLSEAMQAGVPVMATGWSGNTDFMTPENSCLISYQLIPLDDADGAYSAVKPDADQVWAEADTDEAARALYHLCTDAALRQRLGDAARAVSDQVNAPWSHEALAPLPFNSWL